MKRRICNHHSRMMFSTYLRIRRRRRWRRETVYRRFQLSMRWLLLLMRQRKIMRRRGNRRGATRRKRRRPRRSSLQSTPVLRRRRYLWIIGLLKVADPPLESKSLSLPSMSTHTIKNLKRAGHSISLSSSDSVLNTVSVTAAQRSLSLV